MIQPPTCEMLVEYDETYVCITPNHVGRSKVRRSGSPTSASQVILSEPDWVDFVEVTLRHFRSKPFEVHPATKTLLSRISIDQKMVARTDVYLIGFNLTTHDFIEQSGSGTKIYIKLSNALAIIGELGRNYPLKTGRYQGSYADMLEELLRPKGVLQPA